MTQLAPLMEGARNCVRFGNVCPGEHVLLLADATTPQLVIDALGAAVAYEGAGVSVLIREPTPAGKPLTPVVAAALKAADLVYELGLPSGHSEAGFLATFDYGTRQVCVRPHREGLTCEAARFPVELFYELGKRTQALLREKRRLRITNAKGSDLSMEVLPGAVGGYIGPRPYEPGPAVPGYLGTFPPGTTVWGDLNYSASGRLVFDAAYHYPSLEEPLVFTIENGWVTAIQGGPEARAIESLASGIANATRLAECGFGLNPKVLPARPDVGQGTAGASAVMAWTRKAGTFFVGMGGNTLMGGTDASPFVPVYAVLAEATITVGERVLVDAGHLSLLDDPAVLDVAARLGYSAELLKEASR